MKQWMALAKLCEELAEVIQVAAKLNACPDGVYFDGTDLIGWLENEMADATAILRFVEWNNDIVVSGKRVEEKYQKFCDWFGVPPATKESIMPRQPGRYYWVQSVEGGQKEIASLNYARDFCFFDWTKKAEHEMFWIGEEVKEPV